MLDFENEITINRNINDVFSYTTDLSNIPEWNYYVLSVTPTSPETGIPGATYHQLRKIDEQDIRISSIERNSLFVVETIPPSEPEFRREMRFESNGEATLITDHWYLNPRVPKILGSIAETQARKGVMENLTKLKTLLENGRVTLQDGRVITH